MAAKAEPVYDKRMKEAADLDQGDKVWIGSADGFAEVVGTEDAEDEGLMRVDVLVTHSDESVTERALIVPPSFDFTALEVIA